MNTQEIRVEVMRISEEFHHTAITMKDHKWDISLFTTSIDVRSLKVWEKCMLTLANFAPISQGRYDANVRVLWREFPFEIMWVVSGKVVEKIGGILESKE